MKIIISIFIMIFFLLTGVFLLSYKMGRQSDTLVYNLLLQKNILTDISYSNTSKSAFDNALKLHNVHLLHLPIPLNIKTLTLKQFSDADLHFCAEDIQIPLLELIQNREENSLLSAIQNYQPYLDIIREPLLTLFLTGYNHITFNIDFTIQINPITSKGKMIILLKAPYLMSADIVIDLKNLPPDFINSLLSSFLKNAPLPLSDKIVQEITLTTKDNGFIKNYHQFTNYLIPEKVQQAQHHNKAIYAYFKEQKGSLRLDYETLSWVLKSAFYKREKSNK